mgnify:CR=1 FL=1
MHNLGQIGNDIFLVCSFWFLTSSHKIKGEKFILLMADVFWISVISLLIFSLMGFRFPLKYLIKQFAPNLFGNSWFLSCYLLIYAIHGFPTHLIDLTNDFKAALFFATCKYVPETDSYRPLTQEDIDKSEDTKYGYIFHVPDWTIAFMKWEREHYHMSDPDAHAQRKRFYLQSGDMDGVALQIGYQPLQ